MREGQVKGEINQELTRGELSKILCLTKKTWWKLLKISSWHVVNYLRPIIDI